MPRRLVARLQRPHAHERVVPATILVCTTNRNGVTLRFREAGMKRLRIQVREDGVSIDQIVLSAVKYRTTRPGTAKNDTVILEEIR